MTLQGINFLKELLSEINSIAKADFAGLGIIMYNDLNGLPVNPLRNLLPPNIKLPLVGKDVLIRTLCNLNQKSSMYHDGFHMLSKDGALTHLCQYFSPPIYKNANLDFTKGGRYRAAQYGSYLENILATGIIGENYGPVIFIKGEKTEL
jgi:hypothetical protein